VFDSNIKLIGRIPYSNISTATSAILQSRSVCQRRREPFVPRWQEPTNVSVSRGKIVTRLSNYGTLHHEQLSTEFPEGHVSSFKRSVSSAWSILVRSPAVVRLIFLKYFSSSHIVYHAILRSWKIQVNFRIFILFLIEIIVRYVFQYKKKITVCKLAKVNVWKRSIIIYYASLLI